MRRLSWILVLGLFLLAGCQSQVLPTLIPTATEPPTATPPPSPSPLPSVVELTRADDPSQLAYVRVVHAAPDVPTIDIYVERLAIGTNLDFGAATEPANLVAGDYFLRVVPRGIRPDAGESLLEVPLSLAGSERAMLVFTGAPDALVMSTYPESLAPLDREQSRVTLINAIEGGMDIAAQHNDTELVAALPAAEASSPFTLPSGESSFTFQHNSTTLIEYPVTLQERTDYTLIAAGKADAPAVIQTQASVQGRANLRAIHAAPTIGTADIYLDEQPLAAGLEYSRASERQFVTSGMYTLTVYAAGADRATDDPIATVQLTANNDETLSLIVLGTEDDLRVVRYLEDLSPTRADEARVAFVNTFSDTPRVRVDTQSGFLTDAGMGDLNYGLEPLVINMPLSPHSFFWNAVESGETTTQIEYASDVQFEAGRSYLYLLTGRDDNQPLILSDSVGILSSDPSDADADETSTQQPGATGEVIPTARFVNAVYDSPALDLTLDGNVLASATAYASGSGLLPITAGTYTLDAVLSGTSEGIAAEDVTFDPGISYTIVAYGNSVDDARLFLMPDTNLILEGDPAHVRLFNATMAGDAHLALAYSLTDRAGSNRESAAPPAPSYRRSMSFGIERVIAITDVAPQQASHVGIVPAGLLTLHLVDVLDEPASLAGSITGVSIEPGGHYDIIAFQVPDSRLIRAFILPYPPSSG